MKIGRNIIIETPPQPRPAKKLSLAGAKHLKLTTIIKLLAVFPKDQRSQSEARQIAEMEASGTQNNQKTEKQAPQKTVRNKTTQSMSESRFGCQKKTWDSRRFGFIFEPWAILGPKWSPSLPREPSGRPRHYLWLIFDSFGSISDGL